MPERLAEKVCFSKSQSSLLNINFRLSGFQSSILLIKELKIPRRRRERERQNSNRFIQKNNKFARASRFFVHFFAVAARLRRENA